jgi:hypothetical protein
MLSWWSKSSPPTITAQQTTVCSTDHISKQKAVKDGILSAFEYNALDVIFTGLTLIPLVKTYYTYITEHYPVWEKVCEFEFLKGMNPRDYILSSKVSVVQKL